MIIKYLKKYKLNFLINDLKYKLPRMEKGKYSKGIVKKVKSGDTIVVLGPVGSNGLPREKMMGIYGVRTLRSSPEEINPVAFKAKEYLR